jgi:hypothetical protein
MLNEEEWYWEDFFFVNDWLKAIGHKKSKFRGWYGHDNPFYLEFDLNLDQWEFTLRNSKHSRYWFDEVLRDSPIGLDLYTGAERWCDGRYYDMALLEDMNKIV